MNENKLKAGDRETVVRVTEQIGRKVEYSVLCLGDVYRLQEIAIDNGRVYRTEFEIYFRSAEAAKAHAIEAANNRAYVMMGLGSVEIL